MEVMRKAIAAKDVYLLKIASIVLPLFFPKNVSAPPATEPESPAVLPDWSKTITIMDNENIKCNIVKIILSALKDNTSCKLTNFILS